MRNTSIWLHHFMRSQTFFRINHIWTLRSRMISFPACALRSFLWHFLPSLYLSLFSACVCAFQERRNITLMLLVTIPCRIFCKNREHPFRDVIRIQRKLGRSAQLGARPQLFVTAVGLPEANHICTCPNVSKPIRAKKKSVGVGGGSGKLFKDSQDHLPFLKNSRSTSIRLYRGKYFGVISSCPTN